MKSLLREAGMGGLVLGRNNNFFTFFLQIIKSLVREARMGGLVLGRNMYVYTYMHLLDIIF